MFLTFDIIFWKDILTFFISDLFAKIFDKYFESESLDFYPPRTRNW
jgi:hypothetical protein